MDLLLPVRPNPASGTPMYAQLVDQVKRGLATGTLRPGDALPEVPRLAEALVVHPNAVVRAYRELEGLGLVTRRAGVLRASSSGLATRTDDSGAEPLTRLVAENRRLSARLAADAADRAARARELGQARDVQQRLLPQVIHAVDRLDYAGVSRAALGVGGDYYDFVPLSEGRLAIALGDVCGKGVPAALLMAALRAYLHGAGAACQGAPGALVQAINRLVHDSVPSDRFVTLFYGVYDPASRRLDYVNAGHIPPILLRQGARHRLEATGLALGLMPGTAYDARHLTLEPGDLLVAFTDGISEAANAKGDEWSEDRLTAVLDASHGGSARAIADAVLAGADAFAADAPQYDDMTLVVARVM